MANVTLLPLQCFQVEVLGVTDGSSPEYFYMVEGLSSSLSMEAYRPGGSNRPYYMSNQVETTDLILRRPLVEGKTKISFWCEDVIHKQYFTPQRAYIVILSRDGGILAQWTVEDVYPKGIAIMPFCVQQQRQDVIGEVITIGYSRLVRTK